MKADTLTIKARGWFDMADADKNGVITVDDFSLMADRIVREFPHADPKKIAAVKEAFADDWRRLAERADTNMDGQITREEFEAAVKAATPDDYSKATKRQVAEFEIADVDGDGVLSHHELARLLKAEGLDETSAFSVAAILDTDGDGVISKEEWEAASRKYFTGDDPFAGLLQRAVSSV
ncbi:calcium binding protein CalD [Streptomyces chlorus]|uniref:EF-hand domain-containing protein n=1 Tax=Streptomyces chlorus TaxID=887452 RepID=A0ABW1E7W7_9ACTN